MIPWECLTEKTERYGYLWARAMLVLAVAIMATIFYFIAYTISLMVC